MSPASARLTASAPSAASATTSRSCSPLITYLRPCRTRAWSSATRILVTSGIGMSHCLRRGLEPHLDTPAGPGPDRSGAADDQRTLADAAQATALSVAGIESPAVVNNPQDDAAVAALERKQHFGGLGVPGDIRQALLRDPVDDQLHAWIQPRQGPLDVPPHPHVRALLEAAG